MACTSADAFLCPHMPSFIYLASQSPRRQELLRQFGIAFELLLADEEENAEALEAVQPRESPRHYVLRVTALKAGAAILRMRRRALPFAPLLVADTTVALGRRILGKPLDAQHATQMLAMLSGRTHRVLTAVGVTDGRRLELALSESRVSFRGLTVDEIDAYVASGEPFGKAGAYAIQGRASAVAAHISGSHSGIVGLPMFETAALLRSFEVKPVAALQSRP